MLAPWLNLTVTIQRRAANPARNALNEPNYGAESGYTTVYSNIYGRIEYQPERVYWNESGERVNVSEGTFLFLEPDYIVKPQDRVTITTADNTDLINKLYIATAIFSEWNSVGNVHHYVVQLAVH